MIAEYFFWMHNKDRKAEKKNKYIRYNFLIANSIIYQVLLKKSKTLFCLTRTDWNPVIEDCNK